MLAGVPREDQLGRLYRNDEVYFFLDSTVAAEGCDCGSLLTGGCCTRNICVIWLTNYLWVLAGKVYLPNIAPTPDQETGGDCLLQYSFQDILSQVVSTYVALLIHK